MCRPRVYTTTETHVCPCSFRGIEFIFPEEIRKGVLPVSGSRDLLSSLTATIPAHPVIPRDLPENDISGAGNGAEIYPEKERRALIWYRRVNILSGKCTYENKRPPRAREKKNPVEIYRPVVASRPLENLTTGLFGGRSSGQSESLPGNGLWWKSFLRRNIGGSAQYRGENEGIGRG